MWKSKGDVMIKKAFTILLIIAATTAQHGFTKDTTTDDLNFGFGVELVSSLSLYMPIRLNNDLMIEPFLSYFSDSWESGTGSWHSTSSSAETKIGFGLFKAIPGENIEYIYGGRLGFVQYNRNINYEEEDD
jgi:hypothetical protein